MLYTMTTQRPANLPAPKLFTLDGEPCDLAELATANDLEPETLNAIGDLEVGQVLTLGGGAGADFVLRRES